MPAAAIVAAGAIGAGASLIASGQQADAARDAADLQAQAARESLAFQREQYEQSRRDLEPFRQTGLAALQRFASIYGINLREVPQPAQPGMSQTPEQMAPVSGTQPRANALAPAAPADPIAASIAAKTGGMVRGPEGGFVQPAQPVAQPQAAPAPAAETPGPRFEATAATTDPVQDSINLLARLTEGFETSPGYEFRRDEGLNALTRTAAARGLALSGGALKDAQRYGEGLAADEFGNFFARRVGGFENYANRLAALSGVGQTATNAGITAGQNFANQSGNIAQQGAAAGGNALLNLGAARASGPVGVANAANAGINNYLLLQALQGSGITGTA